MTHSAGPLYLEAEVEAGSITAIRVGGRAVLVGEGWMEIPSAIFT